MKKRILLLLLLLPFALAPQASAADKKQQAANAQEAEKMFTKIYDMVFGPQGSSLTYNVNIIGIYKTQGDIVYKGVKKHYKSERHKTWEDGKTAYMVDEKKKVINIYSCDDEERDKYLSKFKFDAKNFEYSYSSEGQYYLVKAKLKKTSFFGIRDLVIKAYKKNLYPVSATIKLAIMKTTIQISNFKTGDIADDTFIFPSKKFPNYQIIDHRKK